MDVPGREDHEAELARVTARTLRQQLNIVMDALGDDPSPDKLTPELFSDMFTALQAVIRPQLEKVYLAQVEALEDETIPTIKQGGIGVDWGLINQRAAEWASQYSFELVTGLVDTSRNTLQKQVTDFLTDGRTIGELRTALEPSFGPVRADAIAQTEVTRAASEGEQVFRGELEALGLQTTQIWVTNNDEIVRRCPICWPLHMKEWGDGWTDPPPAHPRCRCWTNTVVVEAKSINVPVVLAKISADSYKGIFIKAA